MLGLGRVGEHEVADIAVGHDIVAKPKLLIDHGGERLDAVGVDLGELLDPAEDIVELGRQPLDLLARSSRCARAWRCDAPAVWKRAWAGG